jgi:hypothetical protein
MHAAARPYRSAGGHDQLWPSQHVAPAAVQARALPAQPGSRLIPRASRQALPLTEVVRSPTTCCTEVDAPFGVSRPVQWES